MAKNQKSINRRRFLALSSAVVASASVLGIVASDDSNRIATERLLVNYLSPATRAKIGRIYLEKNGEEDLKNLDKLSEIEWETRITKDFEQDETVLIDGWLLAKSEAILCALQIKNQSHDAH